MKRSFLILAVLVSTVFAAAPAPAETRVYTMEECLDIAIEKSTTVGQGREQLQTARQNVLRSYGGFLPSASVSMYAGRSFIGPTSSISFDSQGRPVQPSGFDFESYSFGMNSSMMLFDWGVNYKTLSSARQSADAAGFDLQYTKDIVTAVTIRDYYNYVRAKNLHAVQEESVKAAQRNLEQVEAFFKIGSNTKADVLQARVRLGNTQLALIQAVNSEELAKATLATHLHLPLEEDFDVDSSLEIKKSEPDFDSEVQYMLAHRSDLLAQRKRLRASQASVTAAENSRWPTLAANLQYGWNDRRFAENANFFKDNYSWGVGVALSYDIFDRFQSKSAILQAKAQERTAELSLEQAKLDAILEYKGLYLALEEADERIRVSTETVTQAEENLRLAEERYRVGAGTILETIDAAVSLTEAQSSLVEAKCDYLIAKADLLRASGRPVKVE
jgi:outer membrane protein